MIACGRWRIRNGRRAGVNLERRRAAEQGEAEIRALYDRIQSIGEERGRRLRSLFGCTPVDGDES